MISRRILLEALMTLHEVVLEKKSKEMSRPTRGQDSHAFVFLIALDKIQVWWHGHAVVLKRS